MKTTVRMAGGGMMSPELEGTGGGMMSQMMSGLPAWAQALVTTILVMIIAAVMGVIIGKLYASVKYPDPEKHTVLPPLVRIGFICTAAICSIWLFSTLSADPNANQDVLVDGEAPSYGNELIDEGETPSEDFTIQNPVGIATAEIDIAI